MIGGRFNWIFGLGRRFDPLQTAHRQQLAKAEVELRSITDAAGRIDAPEHRMDLALIQRRA
jgi:hypothetical protein